MFQAGRDQLAWVKFGVSIRFAQALQLGKEPDARLSTSEAEERRCTFWSIYVLDRLASCGRHRPPILLDGDCTLRLPVVVISRGSVVPTDAPTLTDVHSIPDCRVLQSSDHFALVVFMVSVFGDVVKWTFEHTTPEKHLPWSTASEYSRISGLLYSYESYAEDLHGNLSYRQTLNTNDIPNIQSCHFVYAHVLYHVNQCLLHHPFLIRRQLRARNVKVPPSFLRTAIEKSKEHAIRLSTILTTLRLQGLRTFPSFYGYAATLAGFIHRLRYTDPNCYDSLAALGDWEACVQFLDQEPAIWDSYKRMVHLLIS